jgi:hypothetical protein
VRREWRMKVHSHFAIRHSQRHETSRKDKAQVVVPAFSSSSRQEKHRRRNADRRNWYSAVPSGHGRAPIGGRPSIGVPPRLWLRRPNATTQLQFRATRDEAAVGLSPELASLGTAMLLADRS